MSTDPDRSLAQRVRGMQLIVVALVLGVLVFLAVVLVILAAGLMDPVDVSFVSPISVVFGVVMIAQRAVLPTMLLNKRVGVIAEVRDESVADRLLLGAFASRMILACALCESAAFFSLCAFLLNRDWYVLVVPAVCVALMAARFPTTDGVRRWLDEQLELIGHQRQNLER